MLAKREESRSYRSNQTPVARRLLVVDSHYSFEAIRERKLEESIVCRDLDGFFAELQTIFSLNEEKDGINFCMSLILPKDKNAFFFHFL